MPEHNKTDPVARAKALQAKHSNRIQPTPEYLKRLKQACRCEINDVRVTCEMCGKQRPFDKNDKCAEKLGSHPTIKRNCIRWVPLWS